MNPQRPHTQIALTALAVAGVVGALAAAAIADVTVYKSNFSTRAEVDELKKAGGKKCKRKFVNKKKGSSMRAVVKEGPSTCSFRPPVQGDGALPDHAFRVDAKLGKATAKSVRKAAFLGVSARAGGGGVGYELRVFPKGRRFELSRGPSGAGFPLSGRTKKIKGINKRNSLRLFVNGSQVRAVVNGDELAQVSDPDPGQVSGTKLRFSVGHDRSTKKDVVAVFKKVKVAVPNP